VRAFAKSASAPSTHRENATFSLGVLAAMLVCAAAFLGIGASAAGAATAGLSYGFKGDTIGTSEGGGPFQAFGQVATDENGNVYLANQPAGRIDVLDPSGAIIAKIESTSGYFAASVVAVTPDGSTVYASDMNSMFFPGFPPILKWTSDGATPPTYSQDTSWAPTPPPDIQTIGGLAADPVTGDALVGSNGPVVRFDAETGALVSEFDGSTSPQGRFTARGIATAPNRDIYVIGAPGRLEHMGPDGSWKGTPKLPRAGSFDYPNGVAVNPQNGDVAVEMRPDVDTVIVIYTAGDELKETIRVPPSIAGDNGLANKGLAFSPDGTKLYVASNDATAYVFELGTRPGVDPPTASELTETSARLTGVVATGGEATTGRIEYCLATEPCDRYLASRSPDPSDPAYDPYGKPDPWVRLPDHFNLSDPASDTVSDEVTGLTPNTTYRTLTYAINDTTKVESISSVGSFRTAVVPPEVQTGAASNVTDTTADLAGTINALGDQTTYHFEYGPTTDYGSEVPAGAEAVAGSPRTPRAFVQTAKGLQPGTTYHYRLVATNSAGTTEGEDRTFTTLTTGQVAPHRAYEQVTPVDKQGLSLFSNWGFQASADGSAIVYSGGAASADAEGSPQTSRYLARRGTTGWNGKKPLDPPLATTRSILLATTQAVSDDFQHALVFSKDALTPDATEGAANIYVRDIDTGAYQLVGTSTDAVAFSNMTSPNTMNTFISAAPDFSWIILNANYPLLPGAPQAAMYKWTRTDGLSIISLLDTDTVPTGTVVTQDSTSTTNRLASDDGETFAFALRNGDDGVYRRAGGLTTPISVPQVTGTPPDTPPAPGMVDGMSRDGRFVVFHSSVQLTDSATDPGNKIYRYDAQTGTLDYVGALTTTSGSGDILNVSDDGRTVYFHALGQTVVWRDGQQDVVTPTELHGAAYGYPSPNGRYFEFQLYDGTVHLYDAVAGEETCVSCPADGSSAGIGRVSNAPDRNLSNRFSQVVTDDGHAFFDTTAPLISTDHNGTSDVYEYFQGRLALISPGDRDFIATLADISTDGSTVFFTTSEGLVAQDTDQGYDIYAARIGGGFPESPAPPAGCSGEACRGSAAAPPAMADVGSAVRKATNSKPAGARCRKGTHKVRKNGKARCVKNKRHGKHQRAKHNRGAGR
jgi:hypothetical protein